MMKSTSYSAKEMQVVKKGIKAIEEILLGEDIEAKARLLLCLDRFIDPWFGYNLTYIPEIETLLQKVIIGSDPISVKEDAIHLLNSYAWPPFPILQENLEKVEEELRLDVRYLVNMKEES